METFFRLFHIFLILIIVKLRQLFSTGFNDIQRYSTVFDDGTRRYSTVFNGIQRYSTVFDDGIARYPTTVFNGIRRRYSTVFDGIRRHWDDSLMSKHVIYDIGTKILYEPSFDHNSTQKAPCSIKQHRRRNELDWIYILTVSKRDLKPSATVVRTAACDLGLLPPEGD